MNPSKRRIYAALAGVGLSLGVAGIAGATSSSSAGAQSAAAVTAVTDDSSHDRTPSYTSSVTIPVAADGTKPTDAELQAVATVTADEATAAALANTPGTAGTTELKSVAGNVVWEVDVTATAGGDYDVIIDAGNATVLDTHIEGGHDGSHGGHHRGGSDTTDATDTTDSTDAATTTTTTG